MSRLLRLFFAAWLLLGLPLGQHQALLHALDHAIDQGAPQEKCAEHSLYTAFVGGVASSGYDVPAVRLHAPPIEDRERPAASLAPRTPYLSRAPPASPLAG